MGIEIYEYKLAFFALLIICGLLAYYFIVKRNMYKTGIVFVLVPMLVWLSSGTLFVWKIEDTHEMHQREEKLVFDSISESKSRGEIQSERKEMLSKQKDEEKQKDQEAILKQQETSNNFFKSIMEN